MTTYPFSAAVLRDERDGSITRKFADDKGAARNAPVRRRDGGDLLAVARFGPSGQLLDVTFYPVAGFLAEMMEGGGEPR